MLRRPALSPNTAGGDGVGGGRSGKRIVAASRFFLYLTHFMTVVTNTPNMTVVINKK